MPTVQSPEKAHPHESLSGRRGVVLGLLIAVAVGYVGLSSSRPQHTPIIHRNAPATAPAAVSPIYGIAHRRFSVDTASRFTTQPRP
jgi:hypothetical protein